MPIFMIGTQRSGSNLLRLMINQLPTVAAPHPPHIMERLGPLEAQYGDLENDKNFNQLVEDACGMVETNPVKWDDVELDRDEVKSLCRERSLVAVYGAIHDVMAKAWGKETWMCKSMANVYYLPEIERYFGKDAKFIYLYRDGRDVALSFRKALIGDKTFYHLGQVWNQEQQLSLACQQRVPDQVCAVSYEELTTNPEPALRRLCDFLGADYHEDMLDFHRSKEASRTAVANLWSNVTKPLDSNNSNKFLREASEEDIAYYETVAGASLDALGYQRHFVQKGEEQSYDTATLQALEEENNRLKAEAQEKSDPQDLELRRPQVELMKSIKQRAAQA